MTTLIGDYFESSQLSQAAYAELNNNMNPAAYIDALVENNNFTASQATQFASQYTVVDQYTSSGLSGFSATVFRRNSDSKLFFVLRGTEPSSVYDWATDVGIYTSGVAVMQSIEMYNYYQRLIALRGSDVIQFDTTLNPLTGEFDTYTATGAGKGLLNSSQQLTLAGHSLGGHLAVAFAYLFPNVTDSVYVYNSLGVESNTFTENLFSTLGGDLTQSIADKVTHIYGEAGSELVTNYIPVPGDDKPVFIEDQTIPGMNHTIGTLTDALAVYDLLAGLDANENKPIEELTPILQKDDGVIAAWRAFTQARRNRTKPIISRMNQVNTRA